MDFPVTLHLALASIGGLIGGLRAAAQSQRNVITKATDIAAGIAAGAASSHYVPIGSPWLAPVYGMFAGVAAGYALDVAYTLVPKAIQVVMRLKFNVNMKDE